MLETWRHLESRGAVEWKGFCWTGVGPPERLRLPGTVLHAIGERVAEHSAATLRILGAAALIGREFAVGDVAALVTGPTDRVRRAIREAVRTSVLRSADERSERFAFEHPLLHAACHDALEENERRRLHGRLADRLAAAGAAAAAVAHHRLRSHDAGDAASLVALCEKAACEALAALAFEDAAYWFEAAADRARPLPAGRARAARLRLNAGSARMLAGNEEGADQCH